VVHDRPHDLGSDSGTLADVRIATFNILHGLSLADGLVDPDRFVQAVRTLDADVLCLQEVDRNQARSGNADLTAIAAEAMGAVDHRFVAAVSGTPGETFAAATGREQPDAAAYGVALVSRYPATAWQDVRLPSAPVRVPMWFGGPRPVWVTDEPRVAVVADLETPLGVLRVGTTHLSFVPWWNGRQLRLVRRAMTTPRPRRGARHPDQTGPTGPTVLTGDLNMGPRRAARLTGMRALAGGPTFPVQRPARQLDHLLTDHPDLTTRSQQVVRLDLSDHRALVADLD
jgi:endonuclease/exonuclease/phosphatase family metal-dependent hydrolase